MKHLTSASHRLQKMLLRLQPYNITIKYSPGKDLKLADHLSRLSPEPTKAIPGMEIRTETVKDIELNRVKDIVFQGWPASQKDLPTVAKDYWNYRDELTIEAGIFLKGTRVVIPKTIQVEILDMLHAAHQGTEKTKLRARSAVFWRNINKDIDELTKSCTVCQRHMNAQTKEPLIQTEVPPRPWHTIGTDLFLLDGEELLLVSDYYSKFNFVRKIPQTTRKYKEDSGRTT